jgi:hypothetical protein
MRMRKIYAKLGSYESKYRTLFDLIDEQKILEHFPHESGVIYLTDHGIEHSKRVIENIYRVYEDLRSELEKLFTPADAFITLSAGLLHDIGYASSPDTVSLVLTDLSEEERMTLDISDYFDKSEKRLSKNIDMKLTHKIHHLLSVYIVKNCDAFKFIGKNVIDEIAGVCLFHRRSAGDIEKNLEDEKLLLGETIHPRHIVALVSLADAMDTDARRAPEMKKGRLFEKLPEDSRPHWEVCQYIKGVKPDSKEGVIRIEARCESFDQQKLLEWKLFDLYGELRRVRRVDCFSKYKTFSCKIKIEYKDARRFKVIDARRVKNRGIKRCIHCDQDIDVLDLICSKCGKTNAELQPVPIDENDWRGLWDHRLKLLNDLVSDKILNGEIQLEETMQRKAKQVKENLEEFGFRDSEVAMILGAAWLNGIALPLECVLLGQILLSEKSEVKDIEESYTNLKAENVLLPVSIEGCNLDQELCLLRSTVELDIPLKLLVSKKIGKEPNNVIYQKINQVKIWLQDIARRKTTLNLWASSLDHVVWKKYQDQGVQTVDLGKGKELIRKILNIEKTHLFVSLEYGTGLTAPEFYDNAKQMLKNGTETNICIVPKRSPLGSSGEYLKSDSEEEWEITNKKLRDLWDYGDVKIFEVPEPFHNWHIWLALDHGKPLLGLAFYRLGSLPILQRPFSMEGNTDTAKEMIRIWTEMTAKFTKKYE